MQSIAAVMQERGERYRERIAGVSERLSGQLSRWIRTTYLNRASQLERFDTVARRTFGLDNAEKGTEALNLSVLSGGRAIVQVAPELPEHAPRLPVGESISPERQAME